LTPAKRRGNRKRWVDQNGNIYAWDRQHGKLEKYDKKGKHLGEYDPKTGKQTKPSDKGRKIEKSMVLRA
jgi:hypothetical protein